MSESVTSTESTVKVVKPLADRLLNLHALATYTSFSEQYWYQSISEKRCPIPFHRFGRELRFKLSDVDTWIGKHRVV